MADLADRTPSGNRLYCYLANQPNFPGVNGDLRGRDVYAGADSDSLGVMEQAQPTQQQGVVRHSPVSIGQIWPALSWTWIATLFAEGVFLLAAPLFSKELLSEVHAARPAAWQFLAASIILIGLGPDWFRQGIRLVTVASLLAATLVFFATFQVLLGANAALAGLVIIPPLYTSAVVCLLALAFRAFLSMHR